MSVREIQVTRQVDASQEDVWALVADVSSWTRWGPWESAELEHPGSRRPDGPGAIRRLRSGRWTVREYVLAADAPHRLRYRVLSGLPVRDYVGEVRLERRLDGGTTLAWWAQFESRIPGLGWFLQRRLWSLLAEVTARLAAFAEDPPQTRAAWAVARSDGQGQRAA
jgi:uncharacterized protein YndB with AHSA1/START domain